MDDLELAKIALGDSDNQKPLSIHNPVAEVEESLVSLLRHRIDKLQEDEEFESALKQAMIDRLPEASYAEMIIALDKVQVNKNMSVEKILSPFIPKVGDRIPLLDSDKNTKSIDEQVFDKATKKDLEALTELAKLLNGISKKDK